MAEEQRASVSASKHSGKVLLYILGSYAVSALIAFLADPRALEMVKQYPWAIPLIGGVNLILVWLKKYLEER